MNMLSLLTGGMDYVSIVKEYIDKIFVHEAKKYHCEKTDLSIIITYDAGSMLIMTYSKAENKIWRVIPDKEVQDILMK